MVRILGVAVLALAAEARAQCLPRLQPWESRGRSIWYLKGQPDQPVPAIHVAGGVATTLVFPGPVDPDGTKLVGGDGRFEPLAVAGRTVVIIPVLNLAANESFSLSVSLRDGTTIPFRLIAPPVHQGSDGPVGIFLEKESTKALQRALDVARLEVERLSAEKRLQEESPDHAWAVLLAQGKAKLTPFRESGRRKVVRDQAVDLRVVTFKPNRPGQEFNQSAVVFSVTNRDPVRAWDLDEVRLMSASTGASKSFAMAASAPSIDPGATGLVAVVMDPDALGTIDGDRLVLELWSVGGLQAKVDLASAGGELAFCQ